MIVNTNKLVVTNYCGFVGTNYEFDNKHYIQITNK